jgi:hypothetical protein
MLQQRTCERMYLATATGTGSSAVVTKALPAPQQLPTSVTPPLITPAALFKRGNIISMLSLLSSIKSLKIPKG